LLLALNRIIDLRKFFRQRLRDEVAKAVGVVRREVEEIEEGKKNPLAVPSDVMASVMEVFVLPLEVVEKSVRCELASRSVQAGLSQPARRSTGALGRAEYNRAMSDLAVALSEKEGKLEKIEIPRTYLEGIASALRRRGRSDLV